MIFFSNLEATEETSILSRHTIDSSIEDNMLDISLNLSAGSENSGYFCKLCNYRTESEAIYVRHQTHAMHLKKEKRLKTLKKNYGLSEKKLKKFRCPDCNLSSFHRDVIRVHRKQSHASSLENSTAKSSSTVQPTVSQNLIKKKYNARKSPNLPQRQKNKRFFLNVFEQRKSYLQDACRAKKNFKKRWFKL